MIKDEPKLIGLELELMIADREGNIQNRADDILNHSLASEYFAKESNLGVVEINGPPSSSLGELENGFRAELNTLNAIVDAMGIIAIPISELGPNSALKNRQDSPRYKFNEQVLGEERRSAARSLCGTHLHIDRESAVSAQYNLMQSMDPVFVFLSTSSFLKGTNTLNCNRVNSYRYKVFGDFPLHGQLLNYINSRQQLEDLHEQKCLSWLKLAGSKEAAQYYGPYSSCWGPIRLREKTIEVRNADANIFSHVMAMAALYKGINNYVFGKGLGVEVSSEEQGYSLTKSEIIIPSYQTLKKMENEGIHYGLRSEEVYQYLSYLLDIAEEGLPDSERKYLEPFKQMLNARRNIADLICAYAKHIDPSVNGRIGTETAQKLNMFMHDLYSRDLAN